MQNNHVRVGTRPSALRHRFRPRSMLACWAGWILLRGLQLGLLHGAECALYPLAIPEVALARAIPQQTILDLFNGQEPGQFGWLTWAGSPSETTLLNSLAFPEDSREYVNPDNPVDRQLSTGDWVQAKPGVGNSAAVRTALTALLGRELSVPVWRETRGQGQNAAYRVSGFVRVELIDFQLPQCNHVTARFLGVASCDPLNRAPLVEAGSDQSLQLPATAALQSRFTDDGLPAGSTLTAFWQLIDGPGSVSFEPANTNTSNLADLESVFTSQARFSDEGLYTIEMVVSDGELIGRDRMSVTVNRTNQPPIALSQSLDMDEDGSLTILLQGVDPDGDPLMVHVASWPHYGTLNGAADRWIYTPTADYNGSDTFQFIVNDRALDSAPATVDITIHPVNDPPIADPLSVALGEDQSLVIALSGSDVEGQSLTYTIPSFPLHGTLQPADQGSSPNQFLYQPDPDYYGPDSFSYSVNDGALDSLAATVHLTVTNVNDAPIVDAGPDQFINGLAESWSAPLAGSILDDGLPGGTDLRSVWTQVDGPGIAYFSPADNPTTTVQVTRSGVYLYRLTASDGEAAGVDEVSVTFNEPPRVEAGPDLKVTRHEAVTLHALVADDGIPVSDRLALRWSKTSGPGEVWWDHTSAPQTKAWFSQPGDYVLRLTATDQAMTVHDEVSVTVLDNDPPQVDAGPDQILVLARPTTAEPALSGGEGPLPLTAISADFHSPIGIDHHEPSDQLIMSVYYANGGLPYNFERVAPDGRHQPYSVLSGFTDELKLAISRSSGTRAGGFAPGELFTGSGTPGVIIRLSADGATVENPWVTLPEEPGLLRGSLYIDRTGVFGYDLIAVTTAGGVWRVSPAGEAILLASLHTHLEGLVTVPHDSETYGPWAGKILAGAEEEGRIYAVDPQGGTIYFELGIAPEDIELIPAGENFYGVGIADGTLWGAPASAFAGMTGDLLFAEEFPGNLWRVHWNGSAFTKELLAQITQWEHVTFSPAGLREIAAVRPVLLQGTVRDDGFPMPSELSLQWTRQSGPGSVQFLHPREARTEAIFSEPGDYVLRLSASDGALEAFDELTVRVRLNEPPQVDAGPDLTLPPSQHSIVIHGSVTDDGLPEEQTLSTVWSMVSGPGRVTFSAPSYDARHDFSFSSNPTATWSYGFIQPQSIGADLNLFTQAEEFPIPGTPGFIRWSREGSQPTLWFNRDDNPLSLGQTQVPPDLLMLYPDHEGRLCVVRWTAPLAGRYILDAAFVSLGNGVSEVSILRNGVESLTRGPHSGLSAEYPYHAVLELAAGDTLDFTVGPGFDHNDAGDNTGLRAVISLDSEAVTTATFSLPGTYVLRLSGHDAEALTSDEVTVTVSPDCLESFPGWIAHWDGEEDARDDLGGHHGTLMGGITFQPGKIGSAFFFDGLDDRLKVPPDDQLNVGRGSGFTLEGWIRPETVLTTSPLVEWFLHASALGPHLWLGTAGPGSLYANLPDRQGRAHILQTASGLVQENAWQHVALTYDQGSGIGRLHLNGQIVSQQFLGGFEPRTDAPIYFGFRPGNGTSDWRYRGALDEWALYNRALTAEEVASIFHAGDAGQCPLPPPQIRATYLATEEFSPTSNPHGVWSYGWSTGWNNPFQPFPISSAEPLLDAWVRNAPYGTIYPALAAVRTNVEALLFGYIRLSPEQLMLHPGPSGEYAILRWTTPDDGLYRMRGDFENLSLIGSPYPDVHVLANATNLLFTSSMSGGYQRRPFRIIRSLQTGDTVDFLVGYGPDRSYGVDNTGLRVCIEALAGPSSNLPPLVLAGADLDLPSPTTIMLDGHVSDDGWPADSALTVHWLQIEGPGTVTFNSSYQPNAHATFPLPGQYRLRLTAQDGFAESSEELRIHVHEAGSPNLTPQANAGPDQSISTSTADLQGAALDDGLPIGAVLSFSWSLISGPGSVNFSSSQSLETSATFSGPGTYLLRLSVSDGQYLGTDDVLITLVANQRPLVQAGLDRVASVSKPITLSATVQDDGLPSGVLTSHWEIISGPETVPLGDSTQTEMSTSVIASFPVPGRYELRVTASDSEFQAFDDLAVTVLTEDNQPPTVRLGPNQTIPLNVPALLHIEVADDGLPQGVLTYHWEHISGSGEIGFEETNGTAIVRFAAEGVHTLGLTVSDGTAEAHSEATVTVIPSISFLRVDAGPNFELDWPGSVTLTAFVDRTEIPNETPVNFLWTQISGPGQATWTHASGTTMTDLLSTGATFSEPGQYELRIGVSRGEESAWDDILITLTTPPSPIPTSIHSPLDGTSLTAPTPVIGSVSGDFLDFWSLRYRLKPAEPDPNDPIPAEKSEWTVFGSGESPVDHAPLAAFDPTLLLNGIYELQLVGVDRAGLETETEPVTVMVDRQMKIGHFTLSFTDASMPLPGLPLQIIRTYDSRAALADRKGDFGVGWTLQLKDVRLQKNRPLGRQWVQHAGAGPLPFFTLDPVQDRIITLTFPDDRVEKFRFDPAPSWQALLPIDYPRWHFTPFPGTRGFLEPAALGEPDGEFLVAVGSIPGTVSLHDLNYFTENPLTPESTLDRYPTLFRYTSPEGWQYLIDERDGLRQVSDRNGNTLLIQHDCLIWTNLTTGGPGLGFALERDEQNRLTQVTDANGHALHYSYNPQGDLSSFVDRDGLTNRFVYDTQHRLLQIYDARQLPVLRNVYDEDNRLIQSLDASGHSTGYFHDLINRREFITNRLGFITVLTYDERGNILQRVDPTGAIQQFVYDANDNLLLKSNVHDCACGSSYTYDAADNRITETDALGHTTRFTYNAFRQILTTQEPDGFTTTNAYDAAGNLIWTNDDAGQQAHFTYDPHGKVTTLNDPRGYTTRFAYNEFGFLTNEVDAVGRETSFTTDAMGHPLSQTLTAHRVSGLASLNHQANGWLMAGNVFMTPSAPVTNLVTLIMRYEYTPSGFPLRILYYDGSITETVYTNGLPLWTIDPLGRVTETHYDERGLVSERIFPNGCRESFQYDAEGQLISHMNRRGYETRFQYDPRGKLTQVRFPDGAEIAADYFYDGSLRSEIAPNGEITTFGLDDNGNRVTVAGAVGVTRFTYNDKRFATSQTDPMGRVRRYEYDGLGRNTSVISPDNARRTAEFSGRKLIRETDAAGHATSYAYDAMGRLEAMTNALHHVRRFAFDDQDNKISETDPLGHTTYFEYDLMGRRVRTLYPDGTSVSIGYDSAGRILSRTQQSGGVTRYHYDDADNVVALTDPEGAVTTFTHDCGGNLLSRTDANGNTTAFEYDARGRRIRTIHADGGIEIFAYDLSGRLISQTEPRGHTTGFTYDPAGRLIAITNALGQVWQYAYDKVGNCVSKIDPIGQTTRFEYDLNDRPRRIHLPDGATKEMSYDLVGRLTTQRDENGASTHFGYDPLGRLIALTNALQHVSTFVYDAADNLIAQTDPQLQTVAYSYDVMNRRTGIFLPDGSTVSLAYDAQGRILARTDAHGLATVFDYNARDQLTLERDPLGLERRFTYDAAGRLNTQTDPLGAVTQFTYDKQGRLIRVDRPDGGQRIMRYDAAGLLQETVDATGNATAYAYDALGRRVAETNALGHVTIYRYDSLNRLTERIDALGRSTHFEHDARGHLTHTIYPDDARRSTVYDAKGRIVAEIDPAGNTARLAYDDLDRLVVRTNALGQVTRFEYDSLGRLTGQTDAENRTTRFVYDARSRLTRTIYPDGSEEATTYDRAGRRLAETDRAGTIKYFAYDNAGRLIGVTNALGNVTLFDYDAAGRLLTQTDANGHTTTYTHDSMGRRLSRTLPGGESEYFAYDSSGNLRHHTNFNHQVTTYDYDAIHQRIGKYPDPERMELGEAPVTFAYNEAGRRIGMTDGNGTTVYAYDPRDRLIAKQSPQGALFYDYDINGNLAGVGSDHPNGVAVRYHYDALNRLQTVEDLRLGSTVYSYDATDNLHRLSLPNGVVQDFAYDELNQLTNMIAVGPRADWLARYDYALDTAGRRVAAQEELRATEVTAASPIPQSSLARVYEYDAAHRLIAEHLDLNLFSHQAPHASEGVSTVRYQYDPVGNRLALDSSLSVLPSQRHAYDANDRLTEDVYDAQGNTLASRDSAGDTMIDAYDFENRLVRRVFPDGASITLTYDGDGRRVTRTIASSDASDVRTTSFLVDDLNPTGYAQVLEERLNSGNTGPQPVRVYTHGLAVVSQDQFRETPAGPQWQATFYGQDGHGNVRYLTDSNGDLTDTIHYDAFGRVLAATGSTPNHCLFAGEFLDPDLELYDLRARWASPAKGRFWTMDSFEGFHTEPESLHAYTFNQNDPVNRFDPSGNVSVTETLQIAGLAPLVRGTLLSLFNGINHFSYGMAGGEALKFTSRAEAYFIDSLAAGPGWKFGKKSFWATAQGAPFLLALNPNTWLPAKPCWQECIPFDLDVPVYGPSARHPLFEFEESPLYGLATVIGRVGLAPPMVLGGGLGAVADLARGSFDLILNTGGAIAYGSAAEVYGPAAAEQFFGRYADATADTVSGLVQLGVAAQTAPLLSVLQWAAPDFAQAQQSVLSGAIQAFTGQGVGGDLPWEFRLGYTAVNALSFLGAGGPASGETRLAHTGESLRTLANNRRWLRADQGGELGGLQALRVNRSAIEPLTGVRSLTGPSPSYCRPRRPAPIVDFIEGFDGVFVPVSELKNPRFWHAPPPASVAEIKTLNYRPTSGALLQSDPGRTTTILGRYQPDTKNIIEELGRTTTTDLGPRPGDFNVLQVPQELVGPAFWSEFNEPWLRAAVDRGDKIILATEPTWDNLTYFNSQSLKLQLTGFGKEYLFLKKLGYRFEQSRGTMIRGK